MRSIRIPFQNPPPPKILARGHAIQRYSKLAVPQALRRHAVKNIAQFLALLVRALDLFRAGLDELFPYLQFLRRETSFPHPHPRAATNFPAARHLSRDPQLVFPGLLFEVNPHQAYSLGFTCHLPPERDTSPVPVSLHF